MRTRTQRIGDAILFGGVCSGSVALLICVVAGLVAGGALPAGLPASDVSDAFTGGLWSLASAGVAMIIGYLLSRKGGKR